MPGVIFASNELSSASGGAVGAGVASLVPRDSLTLACSRLRVLGRRRGGLAANVLLADFAFLRQRFGWGFDGRRRRRRRSRARRNRAFDAGTLVGGIGTRYGRCGAQLAATAITSANLLYSPSDLKFIAQDLLYRLRGFCRGGGTRLARRLPFAGSATALFRGRCPLRGSGSAPGGATKSVTGILAVAAFMNSVQIGSAASAPERPIFAGPS